jgi:hypothetical protein
MGYAFKAVVLIKLLVVLAERLHAPACVPCFANRQACASGDLYLKSPVVRTSS